jgi:putative protease
MNNRLELLAPAKNLECGLAAIRHGADAVYIGAPKFGARMAAGNSIEEIEKLATEARVFGVKTYIALNTILFDAELEEAQKIIWQVYEAGADALIIQDFGILEMNLPPIALHASTQANNFTVEKIKFLQEIGFKRAVLARELSIGSIKEIAAECSIELEAFVHGSLCVSLSGQCYMSHAVGGRSANRGACAQPCRKKYTLTDATGRVVVKEKHLLSLKDLNRSKSLDELIEAGVRSFKIEGRLKEMDYVKNITAYYRKELDLIMAGKPQFRPSSMGKTTLFFQPDPAKTFHRGATEYFLHGRKESVAGTDSPKSMGELLGEVTWLNRDSFRISGERQISNNDGLTFVGRNGESSGLKVNKAENGLVFPDKMNDLFSGARVYRNWDHAFQTELGKKTASRKIRTDLTLAATDNGFKLSAILPDHAERLAHPIHFSLEMMKTPANDIKRSQDNIATQLAKSGDTPFLIHEILTGGNEKYFFTSQQLNELRRGLLSQLQIEVGRDSRTPADLHQKQDGEKNPDVLRINSIPFPTDDWHFENNISNRLALAFYRRHGLAEPQMAVEKQPRPDRLQVMITRHCLQHELGFCSKFGGSFPNDLVLPLTLLEGSNRFELAFDCKKCMMRLIKV